MGRDLDKYYEFHRARAYHIDECKVLADEVHALVKEGKFN